MAPEGQAHWEAWDGNGIVLSHAARVDSGCILFHNVTLGEGIDPETREVGAPHLEEDVHVGPGATLLGPITVGAGTKIQAGAVLTQTFITRRSLSNGMISVVRSSWKKTPVCLRAAAPVTKSSSSPMGPRRSPG